MQNNNSTETNLPVLTQTTKLPALTQTITELPAALSQTKPTVTTTSTPTPTNNRNSDDHDLSLLLDQKPDTTKDTNQPPWFKTQSDNLPPKLPPPPAVALLPTSSQKQKEPNDRGIMMYLVLNVY